MEENTSDRNGGVFLWSLYMKVIVALLLCVLLRLASRSWVGGELDRMMKICLSRTNRIRAFVIM